MAALAAMLSSLRNRAELLVEKAQEASAPLVCLQASRRGGFVHSRRPGDGFVYVSGQCAFSLEGVVPVSPGWLSADIAGV